MDREMTSGTPEPQANPGFALGQLLKAQATQAAHPDQATRARAGARVRAWLQVLAGMADGTLRIGSRTPVADVPAWVTTEVLQGGFASGNLAAGGPLQTHEHAWLERIGARGKGRPALSAHVLGPQGFAELVELLETGCFRVEAPEEAALLTVAWLVQAGDSDAAAALLAEIAPWMDRLRFYPVPAPRARAIAGPLCVQTVGEAVRRLEAIAPRARVLSQRETIQAWLPLYDRLVACFLETLDGPPPTLRLEADRHLARNDKGYLLIEGGWPCRVFPAGWQSEARAVLAEYMRLRESHPVSQRFRNPNGNFRRLMAALEETLDNRLTDGRVRQVRHILAEIDRSRGLPDTERCRALRAQQAANAARPARHELAKVLAQRLDGYERDDGLTAPEALLGAITTDEARRFDVLPGAAFVPSLVTLIRRSEVGSLEQLIARGQVPSSEVLAGLIPAISAATFVEPLEDVALQRLIMATYLAFRRRRSVLLFNYEKQVQFEELPWIRALGPHLAQASTARAARETLRTITWTALTAFPATILPNPLVREMAALAKAGGLDLPLVEELAADIFMGGFTPKFLQAAQQAGHFLQGTLYARYYGLPIRRLARMGVSRDAASPESESFSALCAERAERPQGRSSRVAANGTVIEQSQILTTHNLAPLVAALDLARPLAEIAEDLAKRCFLEAVRLLRPARLPWRTRLHALKNAAYAWRQMVFFLSLLPEREHPAFAGWMRERLAQQQPAFRARFLPAITGLERAIAGDSAADEPASPFLGWTTGQHWFLSGEVSS